MGLIRVALEESRSSSAMEVAKENLSVEMRINRSKLVKVTGFAQVAIITTLPGERNAKDVTQTRMELLEQDKAVEVKFVTVTGFVQVATTTTLLGEPNANAVMLVKMELKVVAHLEVDSEVNFQLLNDGKKN